MSNLPLTLTDCKEAFEQDGSLRDIYIQDTTLDDWQRFIKFVEQGKYDFAFTRGGILSSLPEDVRKIISQENSPLLSISINGMMANCHCFSKDEIELDIDPKEIISEENFRDFMEFVSSLGQALAKEVRVTLENLPDKPLFLFMPENDEVRYLSYG